MLFCPFDGVNPHDAYNRNAFGLRWLHVKCIISTGTYLYCVFSESMKRNKRIHRMIHSRFWCSVSYIRREKHRHLKQLSTNNSSNMCRLCVVYCFALLMYWAYSSSNRNSSSYYFLLLYCIHIVFLSSFHLRVMLKHFDMPMDVVVHCSVGFLLCFAYNSSFESLNHSNTMTAATTATTATTTSATKYWIRIRRSENEKDGEKKTHEIWNMCNAFLSRKHHHQQQNINNNNHQHPKYRFIFVKRWAVSTANAMNTTFS